MGAKIGKRVFWPGSGVFVGDGMFDLLEVGDDVVWGSRSLVFPDDGIGAEPVKIASGERLGQVRALRGSDAARGRVPRRLGLCRAAKSRYQVGSISGGLARRIPQWHSTPGIRTRWCTRPRSERRSPSARAVYERKTNCFLPYWQTMPAHFLGVHRPAHSLRGGAHLGQLVRRRRHHVGSREQLLDRDGGVAIPPPIVFVYLWST